MDVDEVMALPIAQQLVQDQIILQLAYTGSDGAPRVIPIGYLWEDGAFRMWTIPHSAKVGALQADPRVAISIDILGPPPRVLLARGRAELTTVDGVPEGYLRASHRTIPREGWDDFDSQVRAIYPQMTEIVIRPEWAKLLDFETTLPSAVERAIRAHT